MSWNGPVAGTAPYQPPPYSNGEPQTYQYGPQQGYNQYQIGPMYPQSSVPPRPPENRPPKKKGNPIITRYPPPPGYRGPAQPQGSYGTSQYPNQYQQSQQPYPQAPPTPSAYPNQGYQAPPATQGYSPQNYGPPQGHPQQPAYPSNYPQAPNYQWPQQPQQSHPQQAGFSQPQSYPTGQSYAPPQSTYAGYPTPSTPSNPNQQAWPQFQGWQQPNPPSSYPPSAQYNPPTNGAPVVDPNATPTPISAHPATSQSTPAATQSQSTASQSAASETASEEKPQLFLAWDDWDFDFDGAIWPKANEPVDPNLSLGVIIWRPAKQVTRALPSTFADAEEQALKPPAEKLGNGESVSMYFTAENSHEAFLNVRQTDEWYKIQKDPIFVVFTDEEMARHLVPIEECVALRDRPDEPPEEIEEDEDEEMYDSTWNVMDNLEQVLSGNAEDMKPSHSRQDAGCSRDQNQEDILAKLGVTGAPKPPSNEPMPSLPEKSSAPPLANIPPRPDVTPQRANSYGGHRNSTYAPPPQRPYGSMSSALHSRPPPFERQQYDPRNPSNPHKQPNGNTFDGERESPARSEGSNRTLAGSDFESEKPSNGADKDAPPVPQLKQSDSFFARKRNYEDTDQEDEKLRQQDDHTKRKRRSQVAPAYSRR